MTFARRVVSGAVAVLLLACGQREGVRHERSVETRAASLSTIDCAESTDTGYSAGVPFPITVVTVDGKPVETNTANAYYVMAQAADQAGVTLEVRSGFRTMAKQTYLYNCYVNCNCNNCNLAAKPGFSNHQSGHALDLNTSVGGVLSWLDANGATHGFSRTVPSESWHWEWWGGGPGGGPCGGEPPLPTGCTPSEDPAAAGELFKDMPAGSTAHLEAQLLHQAGITTGCSSSPLLFCPSCNLTRAQAVTFVVRAEGLDTSSPPGTPTFTDVDSSSTYYPYVEAAFAAGITTGCSPTEFCPNDAVTRGQMAAFLTRARGWALVNPSTASFTDVPVGHSFYEEVETLKDKCVTTGCSATTYCPDDAVSRAHAALFIARAYDLGNTNDCFDNETPPVVPDPGAAGAPPEGEGGAAGVPSGGASTGGSSAAGAPGAGGTTSGSAGNGTAGESGTGQATGGNPSRGSTAGGDDGGCGCKAVGGDATGSRDGTPAFLGLALLAFLRRRRSMTPKKVRETNIFPGHWTMRPKKVRLTNIFGRHRGAAP